MQKLQTNAAIFSSRASQLCLGSLRKRYAASRLAPQLMDARLSKNSRMFLQPESTARRTVDSRSIGAPPERLEKPQRLSMAPIFMREKSAGR